MANYKKGKIYKVVCPQCEAMAIQQTACHERGCPNRGVPWTTRTQGFAFPVMFPEGQPPEYLRKKAKD